MCSQTRSRRGCWTELVISAFDRVSVFCPATDSVASSSTFGFAGVAPSSSFSFPMSRPYRVLAAPPAVLSGVRGGVPKRRKGRNPRSLDSEKFGGLRERVAGASFCSLSGLPFPTTAVPAPACVGCVGRRGRGLELESFRTSALGGPSSRLPLSEEGTRSGAGRRSELLPACNPGRWWRLGGGTVGRGAGRGRL